MIVIYGSAVLPSEEYVRPSRVAAAMPTMLERVAFPFLFSPTALLASMVSQAERIDFGRGGAV